MSLGGCGSSRDDGGVQPPVTADASTADASTADAAADAAAPVPFGSADPEPVISFVQVGSAVGIDRANEPASAGTFDGAGTLAYGSWLADLDGDGRLDYFAMNHGQTPHLSGVFINS